MIKAAQPILSLCHLSPVLIRLQLYTHSPVYSAPTLTEECVMGGNRLSTQQKNCHNDIGSPVKSSWFNTELWLIEKLSSPLRVNLLHKHDLPAPRFDPCELLGRPITAIRICFTESFCAIDESPACSANNKDYAYSEDRVINGL